MVSLPVYDATGNEVGQYEIDPQSIASSINKQLLHDVVVMYEANRRMGTHQAKTRAQVAGSTKKMYRQKGTGNARAGSRRSNIRRGGGVARTIKPRDYSYRLPKKAIKLATRMAIASKIMDGELVVLDAYSFDSPKTKKMASILKAVGLAGKSALVATTGYDVNVYKSGRNIAGVKVSALHDLNALDILRPKMMLVSREALDRIKDGTFNQAPGSEVGAGELAAAAE
jgi:large subunit ribosomal protein L4